MSISAELQNGLGKSLSRAASAEERLQILLDERTAMLAARRRGRDSAPVERRALLICEAGPSRVALPFDAIAGVQQALEVAPVPSRFDAVVGIAMAKGIIYNVLDLARLLGLRNSSRGPGDEGASYVLLKSETPSIALMVDDVSEIAEVDPAAIIAADLDATARGGIEAYVALAPDQAQVAIVNLERLIRPLLQTNTMIGV